MNVKRETLALCLLVLVASVACLPVTKNEKKPGSDPEVKEQAKEEHGIKYDEGYGEDDPRNRPDVSKGGESVNKSANC